MTLPLALDVQGVSHAFGARQALANVAFRVPQGRFAALLGPNGAGKTTLFSVIARLYACRTGMISVLGWDMRRHPGEALARLGVVFQARTLDADLTVRQNLGYHAALHGIGPREARPAINRLLARIGLEARADDKIRTLSGGQSRRVEIARALIHDPRLLLLDEPTVGLDLDSRADILALVRMLVREEGIAVLWATHIFEEVAPDDEAIMLAAGAIVAQGSAADLAAGGDLASAVRRLTGDRPRKDRLE